MLAHGHRQAGQTERLCWDLPHLSKVDGRFNSANKPESTILLQARKQMKTNWNLVQFAWNSRALCFSSPNSQIFDLQNRILSQILTRHLCVIVQNSCRLPVFVQERNHQAGYSPTGFYVLCMHNVFTSAWFSSLVWPLLCALFVTEFLLHRQFEPMLHQWNFGNIRQFYHWCPIARLHFYDRQEQHGTSVAAEYRQLGKRPKRRVPLPLPILPSKRCISKFLAPSPNPNPLGSGGFGSWQWHFGYWCFASGCAKSHFRGSSQAAKKRWRQV